MTIQDNFFRKRCFIFIIKFIYPEYMIYSEIEKRYCQSCGMPLRFDVEKYLGTNNDNSRSNEFCYYCLEKGEYIVDISMQEMIDIWIKYTDKYNEYSGTNYSPHELRTVLNKRLPTLNRWKQKKETDNIHFNTISKIIDHINSHLFDTSEIKVLAEMSHLSTFHFRRVFKSITGENIASYIQRLRLEHIAHLLTTSGLTLSQIISISNYQTKYSLSKAFRKHFGITASEYRKRHSKQHSDPNCNFQAPSIKYINAIKVLYIEVGNAYRNTNRYLNKWSKLTNYTKQHSLNIGKNRFISISLDDPLITPTEQCRFYLGIIVQQEIKPDEKFGIMQIPKGRYAIFRHEGSYSSLHQLYRNIYEDWMPQSKYYPRNTISFEVYLNSPKTTKISELQTEVYIPVEIR